MDILELVYPVTVAAFFLLAFFFVYVDDVVKFVFNRRHRSQLLHFWKFRRSLKTRLYEQGFNVWEVREILECRTVESMESRLRYLTWRKNTEPCNAFDTVVYRMQNAR